MTEGVGEGVERGSLPHVGLEMLIFLVQIRKKKKEPKLAHYILKNNKTYKKKLVSATSWSVREKNSA